MPIMPPTFEEQRIRDNLKRSSGFRVVAPGVYHKEVAAKGNSVDGILSRDLPVVVAKCANEMIGSPAGPRSAIDEPLGLHATLHILRTSAATQRYYCLVFCLFDHKHREAADILLAGKRGDNREFYFIEATPENIHIDPKPMAMALVGLQEAVRTYDRVGELDALAHPNCTVCKDRLA